jgi:hypothetical protein
LADLGKTCPPVRQDIEHLTTLPPVAFNPDVALRALLPGTSDPVGVGMRWLDIVTGHPDIVIAFPAVIPVVPGPVGMLMRRWRNGLNRALGWSDVDVNLSLSDACSQKEGASGSGEEFLHR